MCLTRIYYLIPCCLSTLTIHLLESNLYARDKEESQLILFVFMLAAHVNAFTVLLFRDIKLEVCLDSATL